MKNKHWQIGIIVVILAVVSLMMTTGSLSNRRLAQAEDEPSTMQSGIENQKDPNRESSTTESRMGTVTGRDTNTDTAFQKYSHHHRPQDVDSETHRDVASGKDSTR